MFFTSEDWFYRNQTKSVSMTKQEAYRQVEKANKILTKLEIIEFAERYRGDDLKETEKAYIAGIVDGEGTISAYIEKNSVLHLDIIITNSNKELIEYIQKITGLGKIQSKLSDKQNQKDIFVCDIRVNEIHHFIRYVIPYLRIKKLQAELLINYLQNRRKGSNFNPPTIDEINIRRILIKKMKDLNKKGK